MRPCHGKLQMRVDGWWMIPEPGSMQHPAFGVGPFSSGILTTAHANALQAYILPETDATFGQPLFPGIADEPKRSERRSQLRSAGDK